MANAAWDVWLGTSSQFQSYLMVWLRDPPGRRPRGGRIIVNDAKSRSALTLPGDTVRAVAVGFEFWTGPFTNVVSEDFYIKVLKK